MPLLLLTLRGGLVGSSVMSGEQNVFYLGLCIFFGRLFQVMGPPFNLMTGLSWGPGAPRVYRSIQLLSLDGESKDEKDAKNSHRRLINRIILFLNFG